MLLDSNSGVVPQMITNREGLIITKNPGTSVGRDAPPPLPEYMLRYVKDQEERLEEVMGLWELKMTRKAVTNVAGLAQENEQIAGLPSIRLQLLAFESLMEHIGECIIQQIQVHTYGGPRPITYDPGTADGMESGTMTNAEFDPLLTKDGEYRVRIGHGSTLPVSRTARINQALSLLQAGVLDKEDVLYIAEFPDAEGIAKRMEEKAMRIRQQAKEAGVAPTSMAVPQKGRLPAGAIGS